MFSCFVCFSLERNKTVINVYILNSQNVFICFGRINGSKDSHSGGVYIEIEFLSLVCTVGQVGSNQFNGWYNLPVAILVKILFSLNSFFRVNSLYPSENENFSLRHF